MGRWQRAAWIVWTTIFLVGVGRAGLYFTEHHRGVYDLYPETGGHWLRGEGLYDLASLNSLSAFRCHPLVAVGFVPLALLPPVLGSALLRLVNLAALALGLCWWGAKVMRGRGPERRAQWFLLVALAAGSPLLDIQVTLLTLGLMLITMAALAEERWNIAALALGVAVCCKAYPISLALVLSLLYPRRFAPRMLLSLLLLSALPFAFQSPHYVLAQYRGWVEGGLNQRHFDGAFQDVMYLWQRWVGPMRRGDYTLLSVAAGAFIALLACWRRRRIPAEALLESAFGMCCVWMMAFGPATEGKTYVLLAPLAALAVVRAREGMPAWARLAVAVSFALLVLAQLQHLFPWKQPIHKIGGQPLAAVLLLLVFARWRQPGAGGVTVQPIQEALPLVGRGSLGGGWRNAFSCSEISTRLALIWRSVARRENRTSSTVQSAAASSAVIQARAP
jgi:hypothetical protein